MNKNERALLTTIEDTVLTIRMLENTVKVLGEEINSLNNTVDHEQGRIDTLENCLCDISYKETEDETLTRGDLRKALKDSGILEE